MKKEKGLVGCVTCGTSFGCFFPLVLIFGLVLVVGIINYFDPGYYWEDFDTTMILVLAVILVPALFAGLIQAVIGVWSLAGFFDRDVTEDELNLLTPIPSVDGENKEENT